MSFETYTPQKIGNESQRSLLPGNDAARFDPFVTLREEGPAEYAGPRSPEPSASRRGSQTLRYVVSGAQSSRASSGNDGVIRAGGLQWTTDYENSAANATTSESSREDGPSHAFVVALGAPLDVEPAPRIQTFTAEQLPVSDYRGAWVRLLAGSFGELRAPGFGVRPAFIAHVRLDARADVAFPLERGAMTLVYAMHGSAQLGPQPIAEGELAFAREPRSYVALGAQGAAFEALVLSALPIGDPHATGALRRDLVGNYR